MSQSSDMIGNFCFLFAMNRNTTAMVDNTRRIMQRDKRFTDHTVLTETDLGSIFSAMGKTIVLM